MTETPGEQIARLFRQLEEQVALGNPDASYVLEELTRCSMVVHKYMTTDGRVPGAMAKDLMTSVYDAEVVIALASS